MMTAPIEPVQRTTTATPPKTQPKTTSPPPGLRSRVRVSDQQIIAVDVGPYHLAVDADDMRGVHNDAQPLVVESLGRVVRSPEGVVAAIDLCRYLNVATPNPRQPMVVVRTSTDASTRGLGLLVDSTSRPHAIAAADRHAVPDWVARGLRIPATAWVTDRSGNAPKPRLVLDTYGIETFDETEAEMWPPTNAVVPVADRTCSNQPDSERPGSHQPGSRLTGRGLLIFAPAESSRADMLAALAIPMACVVEVSRPGLVRSLPSRDPHLHGVTLWNNRPLPVLWLGDALGLTPDRESRDQAMVATAHGQNVAPESAGTAFGDSMSCRMIVIRTPGDQWLACLAHAPMRSLKAPASTGPHANPDMDPRFLLGAFVSEEGPLAVPDLDGLLSPERWKPIL